MKGYHAIHSQEELRTCIYVKDSSIKYLLNHHAEKDQVTITMTGNRTIRAVYHPTGPVHSYDNLTKMIDGEVRMGDFNAPWKTYRGKNLQRWIEKEGALERSPDEPSHNQGNKLDLIITKDRSHLGEATTIYHNGNIEHSDHSCHLASILIPIPPDNQRVKKDYRKVDIEPLIDLAKGMREAVTVDDLISQLETLKNSLKSRKYSDRHRLPLDLLDKKRAANATRGKDNHQQLRLEYRMALRDHVNKGTKSQIEKAEEDETYWELARRGTKKKLILTLTDDTGRKYVAHREIAQCLAKHYGEDDPLDENSSDNTTPPSGIIPNVTNSEISEAIQKAPMSSMIGIDDIGIPVLKAYHLGKPVSLSRNYTEILRSGRHPTDWKEATVVTIPKANKPTYAHPKAWRSIHLLSLVSTTLEHIILNRLQDYDDDPNNLDKTLGPTQFGSRRGKGTSDTFRTLMNWKTKAESEGNWVTLIVGDVEGGFDKVDPGILTGGNTDLDPRYNKWIRNWSTNRRISFRFNDMEDEMEYVTGRGIPQGSPSSPGLFRAYVKTIMYSDGLTEQEDDFLLISYVDDVLICIKGKTEEEMAIKARAA